MHHQLDNKNISSNRHNTATLRQARNNATNAHGIINAIFKLDALLKICEHHSLE